jgi:hypothetical protein
MITISDALPIQFWDADDETFNEKENCAITKDCFCQPFNGDDEINIQFTDSSYASYQLQVLDENDNELALLDFTNIGGNVWYISLNPVAYGINYFKIISNGIDVTFDSSLSPAVNAGAGNAWSWSSGKANVTLPNNFSPTRRLQIPFNSKSGNLYNISFNADIVDGGNGAGATTKIIVYLTDGVTFTDNYSIPNLELGLNQSFSVDITANSNWTYLEIISICEDPSSYARVVSLDNIVIPTVYLKKSDCINTKDSHDCTKLIEYSNESDFDGISYSDISPRPTFYLRIPAMFFEEENPQEQEDLVLSNGVIVTLRQEIQEKRLLETGYMPNYMHKKLQKVLMHESITIDGDGWKRRDAYEPNPIKKYALKRASVLLTKYNSVLKNTI